MDGLTICEQSEGYADAQPDGSCTAYWDDLGSVWTCGFGTTGAGVVSGTHWSRAEAVQNLLTGWNTARSGVLRASPCLADPANANRLDAITDFAYNEGVGRYQASSLRTYVNQGNFQAASLEFPKWNLAGGKVQAGLVTRRHLEQVLFLSPIGPPASPFAVASLPADNRPNAVAQPSLGTLLRAFFRSLFG